MAVNQITGPQNIVKSFGFNLKGNLPDGDTFAEPSVVATPSTAGTITQQPSVMGPDVNGATPFTATCEFQVADGFTGAVTFSAEVVGIDDQDLTCAVIAAPTPETVGFDQSSFVVS
jgi:hypothetical protein